MQFWGFHQIPSYGFQLATGLKYLSVRQNQVSSFIASKWPLSDSGSLGLKEAINYKFSNFISVLLSFSLQGLSRFQPSITGVLRMDRSINQPVYLLQLLTLNERSICPRYSQLFLHNIPYEFCSLHFYKKRKSHYADIKANFAHFSYTLSYLIHSNPLFESVTKSLHLPDCQQVE